MATREIADCSIDNGKNPEMNALAIPIERNHGRTRISATEAVGFEGAEYNYHFCVPSGIEA